MSYLSVYFFQSSNNISSVPYNSWESGEQKSCIQCRWWYDEGRCHTWTFFTNSVMLFISSQALTRLVSIFSSSWCAKTCSGMHFNFLKSTVILIIHKMMLPISYMWSRKLSRSLCRNLLEIFGFLDSSQATPPSEVCRTMVLEGALHFGSSPVLFQRASEVTGRSAGCWEENRIVSKHLLFSHKGFLAHQQAALQGKMSWGKCFDHVLANTITSSALAIR